MAKCKNVKNIRSMIERVVVTFFFYFGVVRLFKKKIFYFILEDTFDGYHGHEKKKLFVPCFL